jgi:hypothetical protein
VADITRARYVQLRFEDGHYVLVLLDETKQECGHGYKGAGRRRAEEDLKYWTKAKGLEELPNAT